MTKTSRIAHVLRPVVMFTWPLPYLLTFAMDHFADWASDLALAAAIVLSILAVKFGWAAFRATR